MSTSQGQLAGRNVLLCLSGGIACYKAADLASQLVRSDAAVHVAMTEAAEKFITPLTFQALTNRPVYTSLWQRDEKFESGHISLTDLADIMVIAPATANIMAKIAHGLADDLVSTLALSAHDACPLLLAPAMNTRMWTAPVTQANVEILKGRGCRFVGPEEGRLACGTVGAGRMAEPDAIFDAVAELLTE